MKNNPMTFSDISKTALQQWVKDKSDVALIDTRMKEDYDKGHVPLALNFPYPDDGRMITDKLRQDLFVTVGEDKNKVIVIYGDGVSRRLDSAGNNLGGDSWAAIDLFNRRYRHVYLFRGGMREWEPQKSQSVGKR